MLALYAVAPPKPSRREFGRLIYPLKALTPGVVSHTLVYIFLVWMMSIAPRVRIYELVYKI